MNSTDYIILPEEGVPENKWMKVGLNQVIAMREELARIKEGIKRAETTMVVDGNDMIDWGWARQEHTVCREEVEGAKAIIKIYSEQYVHKNELAAANSKIESLTRQLEHKTSEIEDYKEVNEDKKRLTKELDVLLNGSSAANQASLCDIVAQLKSKKCYE